MVADMKEAYARIDRYLSKEIESIGIPGLALAITDREKVLRLSDFGFADLTRKKLVDANTRFEIGSISKSFASIVAIQLVEEGSLDLSRPLRDYLPWFEVKTRFDPITPHHILTHTAAITRGSEATLNAYTEALELRNMETSAPPGTMFHYSNTGYKLVGLLIEKLLNMPNSKATEARILGPLGMSSSIASLVAELRESVAIGYAPSYDDRPSPRQCALSESSWVESDTADGSIASTSTDMAAYVRMLLNRGAYPSGRLISDRGFELLTQKAIRPDLKEPNEWYGYGLSVRDEHGHTLVGHSGGMLGFVSYILADMELGMGIVILMNGLTSAEDMAMKVMSVLRAAAEGKELPLLESADPTLISNAADFSGRYESKTGALVFREHNGRLLLDRDGVTTTLEKRGEDEMYANTSGLELFLMHFIRKDGKVVAVGHGPDMYVREGMKVPRKSGGARLSKYTGHYRTHNQWMSNFRVVLRGSELILIEPSGREMPLTHLKGSAFRVGPEESSPETIRFDTIHDGKAMRAVVYGCPCYRTFTR